mgnify:CR=1 FL=1
MANLLILTPRFPYPIVAGDALRIHHICKELSREHSLTLLSMCETEEKMNQGAPPGIFERIERVYRPTWRAILGTLRAVFSGRPLQLGYYNSSKFRRRVKDLLPLNDLAVAHLVRTGQYLEDCGAVPTVLEMTDALSLNYQRVIEMNSWGWKNLVYRFEKPRIESYERKVTQSFDLVSLVSSVDRDSLLPDQKDAEHVSVYPNGIDLTSRPYTAPNPTDPPILAFIGNMRTVHNRDTCQYFAEKILPRIRERIPGTTFRIIGSAEKQEINSLEQYEGVEVTGWVDSIPEATRGALCGIGVMRLGAGLQNKVLEYMALGLPVIANRRGLEGINARPSEHVLMGEEPHEIVEHIVHLHADADLRKEVAQNGRNYVEENHRWEMALQPLMQDVNQLLEREG